MIMEQERDALQTPKVGDVFRMPGELRELEVAKIDSVVYVYVLGRNARSKYAFCSRSVWSRIVAGATVLHWAE